MGTARAAEVAGTASVAAAAAAASASAEDWSSILEWTKSNPDYLHRSTSAPHTRLLLLLLCRHRGQKKKLPHDKEKVKKEKKNLCYTEQTPLLLCDPRKIVCSPPWLLLHRLVLYRLLLLVSLSIHLIWPVLPMLRMLHPIVHRCICRYCRDFSIQTRVIDADKTKWRERVHLDDINLFTCLH